MTNQEKIDRVLKNLSNIVEIKIEDCEVYNEYSVIVLYEQGSDIIVCSDTKQVNNLYNYLTKRFNEFQSENNQQL
ncbi:MAG: hypothetical protein IKC49_01750 [Clostridia bacterium]|nr:hypothetical protein [Clostridia bacterium]